MVSLEGRGRARALRSLVGANADGGRLVNTFTFAFAPTIAENVRAVVVSRLALSGASAGFGFRDLERATIEPVLRPVGMLVPGREDGSKAYGVGLV